MGAVCRDQSWLHGLLSGRLWYPEIADRNSYAALRAVLHTLRDRLPPDEAVDLAAQLPMLVRGFYFEGWHPSNQPLRYRDKDEFLARVRSQAPELAEEETERVVAVVFHELSGELDWGETGEPRGATPEDARELGPRAGCR
jgi:uncharacterized protein (DUF2267 family)